MLHRYYFSPIIHCPSLCPYKPPRGLFLDDYDPDCEEAAWKFCTKPCCLTSEFDRPCLIAHARLRAQEQKKEAPAPSAASRFDRAHAHSAH